MSGVGVGEEEDRKKIYVIMYVVNCIGNEP